MSSTSRPPAGPPRPMIVRNGQYFETETENTGTPNPGLSGRYRASTFAAGDKCRYVEDVAAREDVFAPSWEHPRGIEFVVDLQPDPLNADDSALPESIAGTTQYFATGDPEAGDPGWGFKIVEEAGTPTVHGIVHDGVEEFDLPLTGRREDRPHAPDSGRLWLYGVQGGGGGSLRLWVNGTETFTGGLFDDASATAGAGRLLSVTLENQTAADERRATDVAVTGATWRYE